MSALIRENFRKSSILVISILIANALFFLVSLLLVRTLSFEEFGTYSLLSGMIIVFSFFSKSLSDTINSQIARLRGKMETKFGYPTELLGRIAVLSFIALIFWVLLIPFFSSVFQIQNPLILLIFSPIIIFIALDALQRGFLNGHFTFQTLAIIILAEASTRSFIALLFGYLGMPLLVYASLPISIIVAFLTGLFLTRKNRDTPFENLPTFDTNFFKSTFIINISAFSLFAFDIILIKALFDPTTAGQYAVLSLIGKIIFFAGTIFHQFILTFTSYEYGSNKPYNQTFYILFSGVLLLTIGIILGLLTVGTDLLPLIFGQKIIIVLPLILPYALAISAFTLAHTITIFHLAKKDYLFAGVSFLSVTSIVIGIIFKHQSLNDIVQIFLIVGSVYLLITLLLHIIYNFNFSKKFFSRIKLHSLHIIDLFKPLNIPENSILFLNWRDVKHISAGGAERYAHEIGKRFNQSVVFFTAQDGKHLNNEIIDDVFIIRRGGFVTVYIYAGIYYLLKLRKNISTIIDCHNGVPFFSPLYSRKKIILVIHHVHQEIFKKHLPFGLSHFACFFGKKL